MVGLARSTHPTVVWAGATSALHGDVCAGKMPARQNTPDQIDTQSLPNSAAQSTAYL